MKCKHFKIRKKNNKKERKIYNYCSLLRKEISYFQCQECVGKEYKQYNTLKKRTYKQSKKEKERFSIIYQDLNKCCICGSNVAVELNEIYEGAYRQTSIKYGMVAPMCNKITCHKRFHNDKAFNLKYKVIFQKEFEKTHSHNEFIDIFKQDYIYLYEKETSQNYND